MRQAETPSRTSRKSLAPHSKNKIDMIRGLMEKTADTRTGSNTQTLMKASKHSSVVGSKTLRPEMEMMYQRVSRHNCRIAASLENGLVQAVRSN